MSGYPDLEVERNESIDQVRGIDSSAIFSQCTALTPTYSVEKAGPIVMRSIDQFTLSKTTAKGRDDTGNGDYHVGAGSSLVTGETTTSFYPLTTTFTAPAACSGIRWDNKGDIWVVNKPVSCLDSNFMFAITS